MSTDLRSSPSMSFVDVLFFVSPCWFGTGHPTMSACALARFRVGLVENAISRATTTAGSAR
ncbi:hypothetical protein [Frigoribacterium sp. RIT-PI-h]|uniref:hypothetical protein n=1 Tax=Frigoribacterium sp. RIT-PI-h TaxID=1690245 RepID=UPI0006B9EF1F|nr:hypothetical protein [Frigoribacterium sp. RIT-PI-h]KPG84384.1 hypothetical protein AEQ27_06890 [Frigoribacterium sp. RIT-PI-h]